MTTGNRQELEKLLRRGLSHYGVGELESAIACWEKARALAPDNRAVQEYLAAAYEESDATPRSFGGLDPGAAESTPTGPGGADPLDAAVGAALEAYRSGRLQESLAAFQRIAKEHPERLDVRGYVELVRKALLERWAAEIGDRGRTLRRRASNAELLALRLEPDEAFLLTQIDGHTTIDDLISLASTPRFRTFEILIRLVREGIVE